MVGVGVGLGLLGLGLGFGRYLAQQLRGEHVLDAALAVDEGHADARADAMLDVRQREVGCAQVAQQAAGGTALAGLALVRVRVIGFGRVGVGVRVKVS